MSVPGCAWPRLGLCSPGIDPPPGGPGSPSVSSGARGGSVSGSSTPGRGLCGPGAGLPGSRAIPPWVPHAPPLEVQGPAWAVSRQVCTLARV